MALVSARPLAEKLLIKGNVKVLFVNAPQDYRALTGRLPSTVSILEGSKGPVDVVQLFVRSRRELAGQLGKLRKVLGPKGIFG